MSSFRQDLPQLPQPPLADRPYVLLVEDDAEDEALAQRILRKYHIANQVTGVKDMDEAYRFLQERLSPASGRSSAAESTRVPARAQVPDPAGRPTYLPGPDSPLRPPAREAAQPTEAKAGNGHPGQGEGRRPGRGPELVLISFSQPRVPVLESIRRLRTLPGMERVPMAVCCRAPEDEKAVRDAGLHRVSSLSKPIGFFKLLECIQKMDMHWLLFADRP